VKRKERERMNLEQLKHIIPHIKVRKSRVQRFEFDIVHIFRDQTRDLRRWVTDDVKECDDIGASSEILKNLDLSLDLLLLDGLEHFYDAFLFGDDVHAFEYLRQRAHGKRL
jgi:hypothetical protein